MGSHQSRRKLRSTCGRFDMMTIDAVCPRQDRRIPWSERTSPQKQPCLGTEPHLTYPIPSASWGRVWPKRRGTRKRPRRERQSTSQLKLFLGSCMWSVPSATWLLRQHLVRSMLFWESALDLFQSYCTERSTGQHERFSYCQILTQTPPGMLFVPRCNLAQNAGFGTKRRAKVRHTDSSSG